ncbi:glycosyltransferase [Marinobacter profundi]|uniref:Group 1 glycosyl transferase n=1 Tax=Marinobacter profundi TaxID=2666256 RepID=A0A2G1UPY5_9GAMM|nr:glycosyltransferase [Marinobacter profundi]PHQ16523.1 group 1 glycosyl transferase [Marinobacter profundi]
MNKGRKLVAYVGPYSFPDGGAAARRIYGNCLSLRSAGYDVVVSSGQLADSQEEMFNGIPVVSLNERRHEHLPTLLKHLMYFSAGKNTISWLDSLERKPDAIILYSGYSPYLIRLLPWARKNNVKLIFDVVEWYDPPNWLSRFMSPYFLNIELAMRFFIKKCDGLIVISEYLKKYYAHQVKNIIKVPPTANLACGDVVERDSSDNAVKFVYAGTPGKKDALSSIILAILRAGASGQNVELHIAGVSRNNLGDFIPVSGFSQSEIDKVIKCHGILSHRDTISLVRSSDYSIILRPNIRSVQAGFPTKFVESMAVGTPVIANLTSDLGVYLKDGVNGLICPNFDVESLVKVIARSVDLAQDQIMRKRAKETADVYFSPDNYSEEFIKLIG